MFNSRITWLYVSYSLVLLVLALYPFLAPVTGYRWVLSVAFFLQFVLGMFSWRYILGPSRLLPNPHSSGRLIINSTNVDKGFLSLQLSDQQMVDLFGKKEVLFEVVDESNPTHPTYWDLYGGEES